MPDLDLTIQTIDQTRWSNLESIEELLKADAIKRLSITLDPLINSNIINPEEAYSFD